MKRKNKQKTTAEEDDPLLHPALSRRLIPVKQFKVERVVVVDDSFKLFRGVLSCVVANGLSTCDGCRNFC